MATPEVKVKSEIRRVLRESGAYWHSPVQNGMGTPALDFHVCHRGFYAGIEAKAKSGKPTPRQIETMCDVVRAGGSVFLIDGDTTELMQWLTHPRTTVFPTWLLAHLGDRPALK